MKNRKSILILLGWALNAGPAPAQTATPQTNDPQQKAVEMLREMIYQREKRRGAILPPPATAPTNPLPSFAEIEQQYLQGKITARQFQKYLQDYKIDVPAGAATNTDMLAVEILRRETGKPSTNATHAVPSANTEPRPGLPAASSRADSKTDRTGAEPDQGALAELEKKMDELLRLKAARDKAATNAPATDTNSPTASAPKTKRQRLDDLLKLYIEGKIPEADYKEKRSKIVAEPD